MQALLTTHEKGLAPSAVVLLLGDEECTRSTDLLAVDMRMKHRQDRLQAGSGNANDDVGVYLLSCVRPTRASASIANQVALVKHTPHLPYHDPSCRCCCRMYAMPRSIVALPAIHVDR